MNDDRPPIPGNPATPPGPPIPSPAGAGGPPPIPSGPPMSPLPFAGPDAPPPIPPTGPGSPSPFAGPGTAPPFAAMDSPPPPPPLAGHPVPSGPPGPLAPTPIPPGAIIVEPMNLPPIPLDPKAQPKPAPKSQPASAAKAPHLEARDSFRELMETVVFVVVLVLMLKTFLAEAFVIPTGSMADTLLGYHHKAACQQCGKTNLVNASSEAEPKGRNQQVVTSYQCENCDYWNPYPR